jgi:hypothetical protein
MKADETVLSLTDDQRRDVMKAPDEVSAMLRLKALGWGSKRIAAEFGCARNTVGRWLVEGDWRGAGRHPDIFEEPPLVDQKKE